MDWCKKADIWNEIKRHGPIPSIRKPDFNPDDYDMSLAMDKMKVLYPNLTDEQIKEQILRESDFFETYRRSGFVDNYGWAVPDKKAITRIKHFVGNESIIEVGAGYGLWAKLLQDAGVNVTPTNKKRDQLERHQIPNDIQFTKIKELNNLDAMQQYGDFGVLMLVWPPYDEPVAYETLKAFRGNKLIFVGESHTGCTGCDNFFKLLNKKWKEIGEMEIPQWWGLHDYMYFYKRK